MIEFTNKWLEENSKKYLVNQNVKDIAIILVNIIYDKENDTFDDAWIPYGLIKRYVNGDLSIKLDDAIDSGVIIAHKNHYKFSSNLTKSLALLALKYKINIIAQLSRFY